MEIMTVKELAGFLRINTSVIYSMVKKKEIPYFKVSSQIRFRKDLIMESIDKSREAHNENA